jgi:5-methylcytosine-specific restriction protein A
MRLDRSFRIECHDTKPLHSLKLSHKTELSDLALLCPNCHRMIHAVKQWLTIEELQDIVRETRSKDI